MSGSAKPITRVGAETQQALHPRVATLLRQVERGLFGKPDAPVPEACRLAARHFLGRTRALVGRGRLPVAGQAFDLAGLAMQLGQVLVALEEFEAEHAGWDGTQRCLCWHVPGAAMPVRRLLTPEMLARMPDPKVSEAEVVRMREKLARLIEGKVRERLAAELEKAAKTRAE